MRFQLACLVSIGTATFLLAAAPTPTPTVAASSTAARPPVLGLGFGGAQKVQATAAPSKPFSGASNSLGAIAAQIKLRKLTPEDWKEIHQASPPSTPPIEGNAPGELSATQKQREEAMTEYNETVGPLFDEMQRAQGECRACDFSCAGFTHGSTITTDTNGNWVVLDTSIDNSTTAECRNCSAMCYEKVSSIAARFNRARQVAISKGVFRHELDSGHLVFSNVKD
jgi:hypothetical protein